MKQKMFSTILAVVLVLSIVSACAPAAQSTTAAVNTSSTATASPNPGSSTGLTFNNSAWKYDSANNVYYQIGVVYCATPETTDYETLGVYVPGAYMTAKDNGNGTYTATINAAGSINGFTARTAPMVFPVETGGYSAHKAPTSYNYNQISSYLKAGFIYLDAGMRGKQNGYDASGKLIYHGGAPWGVTDLKAAVRYVRLNKDNLPGNTNSIFTFGMSGGGAQSSLMGATGDSQLYFPYLESIGAAMTDASGKNISDAVQGVMAWCPITSLDFADEAYEWNMGQFANTGTRADGTFTAALSKDLAAAYADYINKLGLKDENGNVLTLQQSSAGIFTGGSYYNYLMSTIQQSLNNFLADTKFPYTQTSGGLPAGGPQGGNPPSGGAQGGTPPAGTPPAGSTPRSTGTQTTTTYPTVQDYIAALNKDAQWVTYDAATNTAKITSLAAFVASQKTPSKSAGAFDSLQASAPENDVFGNDQSDTLHFDSVMAGLLDQNQQKYASLSGWNTSYVTAYADSLKAVDAFGSSMQARMDMYNPMYYLTSYYKGYQTSTVAAYWRINTGIAQGDTANTVEMNLALALKSSPAVKDVQFTTVWGMGHTLAERTGSSDANFIDWVTSITKK